MSDPNVVPFVRRDGTAEFNCTECGTHVFRYTGDVRDYMRVCDSPILKRATLRLAPRRKGATHMNRREAEQTLAEEAVRRVVTLRDEKLKELHFLQGKLAGVELAIRLMQEDKQP